MLGNKPKKYLEVFIDKDKSYFATGAVVEEIREVFLKNPDLVNVKIRLQFFTKRCSVCNKELSPSLCYEADGKTYCGRCRGRKDDFREESARRYQL